MGQCSADRNPGLPTVYLALRVRVRVCGQTGPKVTLHSLPRPSSLIYAAAYDVDGIDIVDGHTVFYRWPVVQLTRGLVHFPSLRTASLLVCRESSGVGVL